MARLYALDANGLGHWLWHADRHDNDGNELALDEVTKRWFSHFEHELKPQYVVACFDGPKNWRFDEFAEYKAARFARPDDPEKKAALAALPQAWADLGVKTLTYKGFEADDAIAALCNVHANEACEVIVVSSDKDMMQLVDERVKQYDPRPDKNGNCNFYDVAGVIEKFGIPPHRIADYLAIKGDAADSVPGVEGWGDVAAKNAIRQTKSLAEIVRKAREGKLAHISEAKQKVLAEAAVNTKDKDGKDILGPLSMSLRLVTLRFDVPVPTELSAFALWRKAA